MKQRLIKILKKIRAKFCRHHYVVANPGSDGAARVMWCKKCDDLYVHLRRNAE